MTDRPYRLLFTGPLWRGSTARHRQEAFSALPGVEFAAIDSGGRVGDSSLLDRVLFRLRRPRDRTDFNRRLLEEAQRFRPDAVIVDSVPVVQPATLRALRGLGVSRLAYYSPDDLSAQHIRTRQLAACEPVWDLVFTTKTFNLPELRARGVRCPILAGKSYHPPVHRPWEPADIGSEFERFDVILSAAYEKNREALVYACAARGLTVVVLGGGWEGIPLPPGCELRPHAWDGDYGRALHLGKVALCPLRRVNRDRITARSIEIPACRRPMIAERTDEHDAHFLNGQEYLSYENPAGAAEAAVRLLQDETQRLAVATAGRRRCETSGYSTYERARWMCEKLREGEPAPRGP